MKRETTVYSPSLWLVEPGRAGLLTLWPMTRREQLGQGRAGLWTELLDARDADWPDLLSADAPATEDRRLDG
jgi:hypothetical protein